MCFPACIWRRRCICCCLTGGIAGGGFGGRCCRACCCGFPRCICAFITLWTCWRAWWWRWPGGGWRNATRPQPARSRCSQRRSTSGKPDLETAGFGHILQLAFVKQFPVAVAFQQMTAALFFFAPQKKFPFFELVRPAEAVEKFHARELRLVKRAFGITGAEVKMREIFPRKINRRRGHHEQAQ